MQFTAARLLSDRQSGTMTFSSMNTGLNKDQPTLLYYFQESRERGTSKHETVAESEKVSSASDDVEVAKVGNGAVRGNTKI